MDKERGLIVRGPREADRFVLGVLAGLGVAVVLALVASKASSVPLKVSLTCLSVSIPFHAIQVFMMHFEESYGSPRTLDTSSQLFELPILLTIVGFGAAVFHVWAVAGVIFGISSILAWIWCGRHMFKDSRVGLPPTHVDEHEASETHTDGKREEK